MASSWDYTAWWAVGIRPPGAPVQWTGPFRASVSDSGGVETRKSIDAPFYSLVVRYQWLSGERRWKLVSSNARTLYG